MSGKSNYFEAAFLGLIFNGTAVANVAENSNSTVAIVGGTGGTGGGGVPITNLYVALHTADPGGGGVQNTSEATYTSYARVAVARTTGGWTVSGANPAQVVPAANITFPAGTGGGGTATFWSVGIAVSGATNILYSGPIAPTIVMGNGVTPILTTASTITEQ